MIIQVQGGSLQNVVASTPTQILVTLSPLTTQQIVEVSGRQGLPGAQGLTGPTGATGPMGPSGQGVPAGGTTKQRLVKKSNADYDTEWVDQTQVADKLVIFQDGDVLGGDADFRWDKNTQSLIIGQPDIFTNDKISIGGALDDYLQCTISNTQEGVSSSADWIATNDKGSDDTHYVDLGINSSVYNDPDFSLTKANDSYLLCEGGDLVIAPITAGKKIVIGIGGSTVDDLIATIDTTGIDLVAGAKFTQDGAELAPLLNRPEILSGTGTPPSPTGLAEGTVYIRYSTP